MPMPEQSANKTVAEAEITSTLTRIWQEILGIPVAPDDNFFDLGGESFEAVRIITRIREELGCEISPADLFDQPTIEELVPVMAQFLA
jgi:acyl carrier protein